MRHLAFAAAFLLAATPAFASEQTDVMKPIRAFIAAIDKGDIPAAAAAHVADPSITDEFPPHHWSGAGSFAAWGADYGKDSAANGVTGGTLTMTKAHRIRVEGDHAYVVAPTDYSYKQKGKTIVEHATMTYALDKTADGWKIASWTFSW